MALQQDCSNYFSQVPVPRDAYGQPERRQHVHDAILGLAETRHGDYGDPHRHDCTEEITVAEHIERHEAVRVDAAAVARMVELRKKPAKMYQRKHKTDDCTEKQIENNIHTLLFPK